MASAAASPGTPDGVSGFQQSLVYRQNAPIARIVEDLAAILQLDRASKGRATQWRIGGAVALVLGVVLFFVGQGLRGGAGSAVVALAVLCVIAGIILLFVVAPRAGHLGVDERRLDLVRNLLTFDRLRADVGEAPVRIALDLRKATDKAKQTDTRREGPDHFTTYLDPWLSLEAGLRDHSAVRAAIVERTVVRRRTKKSRSGKTKTKSKTKARLAVALTLRRPRSAGAFDAAAPPQVAVDVPPGVAVKDVAYKDRAVTIKTVAPGEWSPAGEKGHLNAADLFGRLYEAGRQLTARPAAA